MHSNRNGSVNNEISANQPAIFVHSVIVAHLLAERGVRPAIVAGHSLGEYSALVGAQAISFEDGLQLVKLRGELMQQAGNRNPGTMAAILGLKTEQVTAICREAEDAGVVVPANFNSPEQVVISGSITGVHKAMELAKTKGAKRVVELVVQEKFFVACSGVLIVRPFVKQWEL
ncbi:hypothetical protein B5M50_04960 [candidate division KSB1 bacterium 4484_219]|nr:MAG: hypothetical protein B5M50_04960 [candidate division KSB1 bacterium 4484_219]